MSLALCVAVFGLVASVVSASSSRPDTVPVIWDPGDPGAKPSRGDYTRTETTGFNPGMWSPAYQGEVLPADSPETWPQDMLIPEPADPGYRSNEYESAIRPRSFFEMRVGGTSYFWMPQRYQACPGKSAAIPSDGVLVPGESSDPRCVGDTTHIVLYPTVSDWNAGTNERACSVSRDFTAEQFGMVGRVPDPRAESSWGADPPTGPNGTYAATDVVYRFSTTIADCHDRDSGSVMIRRTNAGGQVRVDRGAMQAAYKVDLAAIRAHNDAVWDRAEGGRKTSNVEFTINGSTYEQAIAAWREQRDEHEDAVEERRLLGNQMHVNCVRNRCRVHNTP
ncbi:MAG: hypothetical protein OXE79_08625 [Acidimicrobiaceae bacterium]|nr:hypothetical protein [Acidimicrobiaceae bacterium]MCY4175642.1 hypothetical protein [Acidimicrobiaceae bacterium]MCY4280769.1 hypothetical protein [Acidimicrobiaceae bacterium]MCY4294079.1 hypothetical protein [Acidimicrobiaceae bacterium]